MKKKDIERLSAFDFGVYLKRKLEERNITMRELSEMTTVDYKVLSKITAIKPKSRNTRYQEFLIIMKALDEDIYDFCDDVLGKGKEEREARHFVMKRDPYELVLLCRLLNKLKPDKVSDFLHMANDLASCYLDADADKDDNK